MQTQFAVPISRLLFSDDSDPWWVSILKLLAHLWKLAARFFSGHTLVLKEQVSDRTIGIKVVRRPRFSKSYEIFGADFTPSLVPVREYEARAVTYHPQHHTFSYSGPTTPVGGKSQEGRAIISLSKGRPAAKGWFRLNGLRPAKFHVSSEILPEEWVLEAIGKNYPENLDEYGELLSWLHHNGHSSEPGDPPHLLPAA